jgi:cell division septum initiation protein DivIVA
VHEFGVETGRVSVVDEQRRIRDRLAGAPPGPDRPVSDDAEPPNERDKLLAKVQQLELELERYRAHAERTSKLFLAATKYAEWVRENARRDAELALRKAGSRVKKLEVAAGQLEWIETELARRQDELARLNALTEETRVRLSAFLKAGLQTLDTTVELGTEDGSARQLGDLQDTLHGQLASTSAPAPGQVGENEVRDD